MAESGGQLNAKVGYRVQAGRLVGTPSVGVGTSQYGHDYRLGLLEPGALDIGLDVSGTRREFGLYRTLQKTLTCPRSRSIRTTYSPPGYRPRTSTRRTCRRH